MGQIPGTKGRTKKDQAIRINSPKERSYGTLTN